jgi:hypothetical protein
VVEIPLVGENSVYVSLNEESAECKTVYDEHQGKLLELAANVTVGDYTLSIATNQLDGKSPSPTTLEVGYNYQHLIVLEKAGI